MSRRGWILTLLGAAIVVVLVVLAPTPQPPWSITSTAVDGTDILRRILVTEFDVDVVETGPMATIDDLAPDDLVVVFEDRLEPADEAAIADHVAGGGRAVVAATAFAAPGIELVDPPRQLGGAPDCDLLPGTRVGPRPGLDWEDQVVVLDHRPIAVGDDVVSACWEDEGAAYLVEMADPSGGGMLVLASPVAVSNGMLANRSGTTQLVPLFVPAEGGRMLVVRGDGVPAPGDEQPAGAIPDRLVMAMWLVALAGGLYVLANARRLGAVLTQEPVVRVPAAELALGVADLLQRHGHAAHAAGHVRAGLRTDVDRLVGTAGLPDDQAVRAVARATGLDEEVVGRAVAGAPVVDDEHLVAVVEAAAMVRSRLGLSPSTPPSQGGHTGAMAAAVPRHDFDAAPDEGQR